MNSYRPLDESELSAQDARQWIGRQLATLRRYWYVTLAIVLATTGALAYAVTQYEAAFEAEKQFVSVKASSNIFSGLGLSALGIGGIGSNPLSSGKGIVTVAVSERILVEVLQAEPATGGGTLLERLFSEAPEGGPLEGYRPLRDSVSAEQLAVIVAAALPKLKVLSADFDIDTEFVTLGVTTGAPRLTEDLLATWYEVLTSFYREQLYGQKSKDLLVLQAKADSLRSRLADIEAETESFKDRYQNLIRRSSSVRLKTLQRQGLEAGAVYKTVLENLEVLRLNVETAGPVFAELNIARAYARRVPRPTLKFLLVYAVATGLLLSAALYFLPARRS